jgi:hypothetical protein
MVLMNAIEVGDMSEFQSWKQPIQLTRTARTQSGGERKYTYRATAAQLKPFFGIKKSAKWPAEGTPMRVIHGIIFWVNPLGKKITVDHGWCIQHKREGMHSRLMCQCPECPKKISYGRLHQHLRVHHDS